MDRKPYTKFDHDKHASSRDETDFWGQIRRTVNGRPVDESQISMIVEEIAVKLSLAGNDVLLDLACGNGALSSRLFPQLSGYLGIDSSPSLIGVAWKYFQRQPDFRFTISGASEYVDAETEPLVFTKALCYGSFPYFSPVHADNVLTLIHRKFANVERFFIGNLPDRLRAEAFYGAGNVDPVELSDYESAIGIWRSPGEFADLARAHGWKATISSMPGTYYAAHYRYDVLLTR